MSKKRVPARAVRTRTEAVPEPLDPRQTGCRVNDLALSNIRDAEDRRDLSDAHLARKLNTSAQQVARLRRTVKVLTVPMLIQWCVGRGVEPGSLIKELVKHARKHPRRKK